VIGGAADAVGSKRTGHRLRPQIWQRRAIMIAVAVVLVITR
jgi:hypothetical protein